MNFPYSTEIILENERVLLRPLKLEDAENLAEIAINEKDLLQYSPLQINTENLLRQYILKHIADREQKIRYSFAIFDKNAGKWAGSSSFLNISDVDSRVEIGSTWIGKKYQKTGLNRNCKFLLLEHCFEKLGVIRVELKTDERNNSSRNAILGIGAQQEGILRSHTLMSDGFRRNTVYFSILKDEWEGVKETLSENL